MENAVMSTFCRRISAAEKIHTFISEAKIAELHEHSFLEFVYVLDGSAEHTMESAGGNVHISIGKGDFFFVDYKAKHSYIAKETAPFRIQNILFIPEFIDFLFTDCKSFTEIVNCYMVRHLNTTHPPIIANRVFHDNDGTIASIAETIFTEYKAKRLGYLERIRCELIALIIETMRKAEPDGVSAAGNTTSFIRKMISEAPESNITLGQICDLAGYSTSYMSRRFKEENGISFTLYREQARVNEACRLLYSSSMKIIDIAEAVGISDIKHFGRIFKKLTGKSPAEYRRLSHDQPFNSK